MMGMGRAMGEILDRLPEGVADSDKAGLRRIRDTLVGAAEQDVEEIVKQWGWHEGLETTSSRGATPAPPVQQATNPLQSSSPAPVTEPPETTPRAVGKTEEITPKAPAVSTFAKPPMPSPRLSTGSKTEPPSPGLTRVPTTAPMVKTLPNSPVPPHQAPRRSLEETRSPPKLGNRVAPPGEIRKSTEREFVGTLDPLAGLGVSAKPAAAASKGGRGPGVDPLGVGFRA